METFILFLLSSHWHISIAFVLGLGGAIGKVSVSSLKHVEVGVDRQRHLLALVVLLLAIQLDGVFSECVSWVFGKNAES